MKTDVLTIARRRPLIFLLACLGAAALLFISEGSYWKSRTTLDEVAASRIAHTSLIALTQGLVDAETHQRGYLLTDRDDYARAYAAALEQVDAALRQLQAGYAGSADRAPPLLALRAAVEAKRHELAQPMRLHDTGQRAAAIELVRSDAGRRRMLEVRALGTAMLEHETASATEGRHEIDHTLLFSRIGVALLSAVSLLALYLYLRQSVALEQQQQAAQRGATAERDRLELDVVRRTAQLTQLAHHLQTAREDERNRLARDLHDELGALLTSAKLDAARIKPRLAGLAPVALERLAHLVATLDDVIALKRRIAEDLRPSALSNLGLVPTLEILVHEFAEQSGIAVHGDLHPVALTPGTAMTIYRLVQESITNLTKYAKATQVWLGLSSRDGWVEVSVRDNGIGFDAALMPMSAYGLLGMRFRVEAEGGTLELVSKPGHGTCIKARLPAAVASAAVCAVGPRLRSDVASPDGQAARVPTAVVEGTTHSRAHRRAHAACPRSAGSSSPLSTVRSSSMLHYAIVFFAIALIAALFGFSGIAAGAVGIAKALFIVFIVLGAACLLYGVVTKPRAVAAARDQILTAQQENP